MTVAELKVALHRISDETQVWVQMDYGSHSNGTAAIEVHHINECRVLLLRGTPS